MDGLSPIDAFLTGRLSEDELLAEVDRVIVEGSSTDRTILISDWRTKSGRIRDSGTRRRLDSKVQSLSWQTQGNFDTANPEASSDSGKALRPGDILAGRFVIETRIGSGGMGTVFKARDLRREEAQDRHPYVAVKTLNLEVLQRADSLQILQREARKAQSLAHPNIVRVHDFDRDGSTLFLTMELLEGTSLDAILQKNGSQGAPLAGLLPILRQVVSALQFAHSEGIVHSDLKPANIIVLPNGRVKVIDFGISRAIPNPNQLTNERTTFDVQALGAMTPAYASPEMIDGQDADPRDDVFALACIVYELLTGRHPFGRAPATVARAGNFSPQQPAGLSSAQWRAVQAGLHFDRAMRTSSPEQLLSGLVPRGAVPFWYRKETAGAALALLIVLGLAGYFIVGRNAADIGWLRAFEAKDQPRQNVNEPPPPSGPTDQNAARPGTAGEAPQQERVQEEAARKLEQQKAADEAAQQTARQKAADEAAQRLAQQKAAEEAAQRQAQQKAAEEAAQQMARRKVADEAAQRLAQQKAAEEAAQRQAQQKAAEEAAQQTARQKAADEAAQRLAQQKAAEEAAQRQAQQKAAEEAALRQAQQNAADDAAQRLVQQRAAEAASQQLAQKAPEEARQTVPQPPLGQIGPPQIAEAQRLLTSMGLNTGAADGRIGPRTQEMVKVYQLAVGQRSTGELTTTLLELLRRTTPSAGARAKGLSSLAAEARRAERLGDAVRLYEAALKLAPNDTDGLLALGDLHRDRNDLDAARRVYEAVEQGHGPAANIARERLAGLPNQQVPQSARTTTGTASSGSVGAVAGEQQATREGSRDLGPQNNTSGDRPRAPAAGAQPRADPTRPFDGVYTGLRQVTGFSNPGCRPSISTTITVRENMLSFPNNIATMVAPDGSFSAYGSIGGSPPVAQHLTGKIQNDDIEAETINPFCKYHMSLKKSG